MTLERCRRIQCCGVRKENGRWPRRFQALLKDTTTTGRPQRLLPGATSASRFGGAFEEGARAAGAVACFVRFSKSTTTARSVASILQWLGFDWAQGPRFASDYFEQLYACACHLVHIGKAY